MASMILQENAHIFNPTAQGGKLPFARISANFETDFRK